MNKMDYKYLKEIREKDVYTYKHIIRLDKIVKQFSIFINLTKKDKKELEYATLYHDAGKLYISNEILTKPIKLTNEEFNLMKKHTTYGLNIISTVPVKYKKSIIDSMLNHHYLNGYCENENPTFLTKIVSIFDIYEALTSIRPYKKAFSKKKAIEILFFIYIKHENDFFIYEKFVEFLNQPNTQKI